MYEQLTLFDKCDEQQTANILNTQCGKTSQEPTQAIKGWTLKPCLKRSQKPKFQYLDTESGQAPEWLEAETVASCGEHWTPNIGESPKDAAESSLSQIIQVGGGTEEILFKPESLPRDTATSKAAQEKTAADTGNSTETAKCYDMSHACDAIRVSDKSPTLQARMGTGGNQIPLTYSRLSHEEITADDKAACLRASGGVNGGGSENLVADGDDRND